MASIKVTHDIDDLANDCLAVARTAQKDLARAVRMNAQRGNKRRMS